MNGLFSQIVAEELKEAEERINQRISEKLSEMFGAPPPKPAPLKESTKTVRKAPPSRPIYDEMPASEQKHFRKFSDFAKSGYSSGGKSDRKSNLLACEMLEYIEKNPLARRRDLWAALPGLEERWETIQKRLTKRGLIEAVGGGHQTGYRARR